MKVKVEIVAENPNLQQNSEANPKIDDHGPKIENLGDQRLTKKKSQLNLLLKMLLQGKKTGPLEDLAEAQKEEAYLPNHVKSREEADPLSLMIVDLNRVNPPLEPGLQVED